MKCLICQGELRHQEHTTYVYASDEAAESFHVIITDVPADLCEQCGERVYAPQVTDRVPAIIRSVREGQPAPQTVQVPLYSLAEF